jgi:uncharacterized protein (UPF0333 family)
MKKKIKLITGLSFAILIILILIITYVVENQVQETCRMAVSIYPGDKIQALINVSKNESTCTNDKSRALWALGQLGDKKALSYLIKTFDGIKETNICILRHKKQLKS